MNIEEILTDIQAMADEVHSMKITLYTDGPAWSFHKARYEQLLRKYGIRPHYIKMSYDHTTTDWTPDIYNHVNDDE